MGNGRSTVFILEVYLLWRLKMFARVNGHYLIKYIFVCLVLLLQRGRWRYGSLGCSKQINCHLSLAGPRLYCSPTLSAVPLLFRHFLRAFDFCIRILLFVCVVIVLCIDDESI